MIKPYKSAVVLQEGMEDGKDWVVDERKPYIVQGSVVKYGDFGDYIYINKNGERDLMPKAEFEDRYNLLDQKAMRGLLLAATDFFELPSHNKPEWIHWRQAIREWKQGDCPIPPNESEYCLRELWDSENHKVKL